MYNCRTAIESEYNIMYQRNTQDSLPKLITHQSRHKFFRQIRSAFQEYPKRAASIHIQSSRTRPWSRSDQCETGVLLYSDEDALKHSEKSLSCSDIYDIPPDTEYRLSFRILR